MTGRSTSQRLGRNLGVIILLLSVLQVMAFAERALAEGRYTVKPGDTLYQISKAHGVSIDALKRANGLKRNKLQLNQVLRIPTTNGNQTEEKASKSSTTPSFYIVKKGDTLGRISKRVGLSPEEMKRINHLPTDHLKIGQRLSLLRVNNPRMGQKPNSSAVSAVSVSEGVPEDSSEEESGDLEEPEEAPPEAGEEARQVITEPGSSDFPGDSAETLPSPQAAPGKWKSPEERNLFIRVVKTFLGVPYRLGGATLKGIDCSAFVRKIYEIFNVELPRTTWEQLRIGKRVLRDDLKIGDLVFFKVSTRHAASRHVGIYIGNSEFVHASSRSKEVRVDSLEAPYFSSRFVNGIRVKELDRDL